MELNYENVSAWFDRYFEIVNRDAGRLETVTNIGKLYTEDAQFVFYTPPAGADFVSAKANREGLMMMLVHPGVQEKITPRYYAINLEKLICVVHFEDRTIDVASGKDIVPAFEASAHYHLVPADDTGLKIKFLEFWTSNQLPENVAITQAAWFQGSRPAFEGIVHNWLKSRY
jgi:hypothetical protein